MTRVIHHAVRLASLAIVSVALFSSQASATDSNPGECDKGGPGSDHCAIGSILTGCDVTCQTGYYACCNLKAGHLATCNCVSNSTGGGGGSW